MFKGSNVPLLKEESGTIALKFSKCKTAKISRFSSEWLRFSVSAILVFTGPVAKANGYPTLYALPLLILACDLGNALH